MAVRFDNERNGVGNFVREQTLYILEVFPAAYAAMSSAENPFGDGHAAERIVDILANAL